MYTASDAFFEALWEGGVRNVFVNLGSDHPSLLEAILNGQRNRPEGFPNIYTCPNEMVALSMADGYARVTSKPQAVIVHVDVGTQGLGAAIHNASCGRTPVLIFAGLSPYTMDGELVGSRTEYIQWIQDVPDQKQIVSQYCRYSGEIKRGANVKQMVLRALQFATSDPAGPVYLMGTREAMCEEIKPYSLRTEQWKGIGPAALPEDAVREVATQLVQAKQPLIIVGYTGRNHAAVAAITRLADLVKGVRVLDTGGSDMCFPADHPSCLGMRFGLEPYISQADFILVMDCDVPWIPAYNRPREDAVIYHVDVDPLKQQMPVFYIEAKGRWKADAFTALTQLERYICSEKQLTGILDGYAGRWKALETWQETRQSRIRDEAQAPGDGSLTAAHVCAAIHDAVPTETIFAIEAITNTFPVSDQLRCRVPGSWINCGGGGLGWSGGGALGIKLASEQTDGTGKGKFVCQIVGDGTYLFSVPSSVYWIAARYQIPILTVVLNNKGWNAPQASYRRVYPEGAGATATVEELNISFAPTPDYAGIAAAASGGKVWAGRVADTKSLKVVLTEAIEAVQQGRAAVLEVQLNGTEGKFGGPEVKQRLR